MQDSSPYIETAPSAAPVLPKRRLPDVPAGQLSLADEVAVFELNRLADEVARYLSAVDTFELEGCAPTWRPENTFTYYVAHGRYRRGARTAG